MKKAERAVYTAVTSCAGWTLVAQMSSTRCPASMSVELNLRAQHEKRVHERAWVVYSVVTMYDSARTLSCMPERLQQNHRRRVIDTSQTPEARGPTTSMCVGSESHDDDCAPIRPPLLDVLPYAIHQFGQFRRSRRLRYLHLARREAHT